MSLCNGCLGCSFCDGGSGYDYTPPSIKMGEKPTMTHTIMGDASCNIVYRYFDGDEYLYAIEAEWYDAEEAWLLSRENDLLPIVDAKLHIRSGHTFIVGKMEGEGEQFKRTIKRSMARHNRHISKALIKEFA